MKDIFYTAKTHKSKLREVNMLDSTKHTSIYPIPPPSTSPLSLLFKPLEKLRELPGTLCYSCIW